MSKAKQEKHMRMTVSYIFLILLHIIIYFIHYESESKSVVFIISEICIRINMKYV